MTQSTKNLILLCVIVSWINFGLAKNTKRVEDMSLNSASKFSEMWLSSPKQYLYIVFPFLTGLPTKNVTKLIQRIIKEATRNTYFRSSYDSSVVNITKHYHNQLLWFPFEIESYNITCQNLGLTSSFTINNNNLLFFVDGIKEAISIFEGCPIRFDSNLVIYYNQNHKNSQRVVFEELYKIDPNQKKLITSVLYQIDPNNENAITNMSIDFIWNRRRDLHGTIFKGVTEHYPPFVNDIQQGKDQNYNSVVNCKGYLCSILDHLKSHLNFSIITNLPNQRHSWSFLIEEIQKGAYDIGETGFIFNPSRNDLVDFSFGVLPLSYTLAYAKNRDVIPLDLYLKPYNRIAWAVVLLYMTIIFIGSTFLTIVFNKSYCYSTRPSRLRELKNALQRSINFVLRSVVGRRISSEPEKDSTRLAFLFLIIKGFLLITCYRALLVASLTAQVESPPVKSLKEILESKYLLGLENGSATDKLFLEAKPGSDEDMLVKEEKIAFLSGGQTTILKNMVDDADMASKYLMFLEKTTVEHHEYYPCRLFEIKQFNRKGQGNTGMVYRKDWPFKEFLNYHLLVMKETGLMDKLYEPFLKASKKSCQNQQMIRHVIDKPSPVSLSASFSLYLIIFIGLSISAICLTMELLCHRYKKLNYQG